MQSTQQMIGQENEAEGGVYLMYLGADYMGLGAGAQVDVEVRW